MSTTAVLITAFLITGFASGRAEGGVQSYSPWTYHTGKGYYYCQYYYKPTPDFVGFKHHFCIYRPAQPRYIYYFNPQKQVYWGRYDTEKKGYSLLADKDRKANLGSIRNGAFQEPGKMPAVPETKGDDRVAEPDLSKLPSGKVAPDLP